MNDPRHAVRVALLTEQRPTLSRLLQEARRARPGEALAGYLLTVREPSGYLLVAGLRRRFGHPDPDEILAMALSGEAPRGLVAGVAPAEVLADILAELSPNLAALADELRGGDPPGAPGSPLRVIVAASEGASVITLSMDDP